MITTLSGRSTAMRAGRASFRSSRRQFSSKPISTVLFNLVTPMRLQNSRIASGV